MVMKKELYSILFLVLTSIYTARAQQLGFRTLSFLGIANNIESDFHYNGFGLDLFYRHDVWKGRVTSSLEYRMIGWGNQLGLNIGYNLPFWQENQWRASATLSLQGGLALFRPQSLGVIGVEGLAEIEWQSKKRFFATLSLGIRYSNSPAYLRYGLINTNIDIPIKLG